MREFHLSDSNDFEARDIAPNPETLSQFCTRYLRAYLKELADRKLAKLARDKKIQQAILDAINTSVFDSNFEYVLIPLNENILRIYPSLQTDEKFRKLFNS